MIHIIYSKCFRINMRFLKFHAVKVHKSGVYSIGVLYSMSQILIIPPMAAAHTV